eukprot:351233-Rhodomonas_salina.4
MVYSAIRLRASYAMSGTDLAYGQVVTAKKTSGGNNCLSGTAPIPLRASYAVSGTGIGAPAMCYAVSGIGVV